MLTALLMSLALSAPPHKEKVLPITNADGVPTASGVLLNQYLVLTAAHAVGPLRTVVFLQCGEDEVAGTVTKRSALGDLALVTLMQPCKNIQALHQAEQESEADDEVEVAGYPASKLSHCKGKVLGYSLFAVKSPPGFFWVAMTLAADIRPGYSGGPVTDKFGKLVGIVHGYHDGMEGKPGVIIPLTAIARFLTTPTTQLPED